MVEEASGLQLGGGGVGWFGLGNIYTPRDAGASGTLYFDNVVTTLSTGPRRAGRRCSTELRPCRTRKGAPLTMASLVAISVSGFWDAHRGKQSLTVPVGKFCPTSNRPEFGTLLGRHKASPYAPPPRENVPLSVSSSAQQRRLLLLQPQPAFRSGVRRILDRVGASNLSVDEKSLIRFKAGRNKIVSGPDELTVKGSGGYLMASPGVVPHKGLFRDDVSFALRLGSTFNLSGGSYLVLAEAGAGGASCSSGGHAGEAQVDLTGSQSHGFSLHVDYWDHTCNKDPNGTPSATVPSNGYWHLVKLSELGGANGSVALSLGGANTSTVSTGAVGLGQSRRSRLRSAASTSAPRRI